MTVRTANRMTLLALLVLSLGSMILPGAASAQLSARVFVVPPNNEIHMASGSASWCVNVEPIGGNFTLDNIDLCSVTLSSPPNGSVTSINYDCTKPTTIGDLDGNGI